MKPTGTTRRRLRAGDTHAGFEIISVEPLPSFQVVAIRARHIKTRADVIHLAGDDPENVYSLNFRTPPPDSTGVAHILEHAVLAGSKRFPVRDAFNELGKSSVRTFLNAFTGSDYTCYPVASAVEPDFYNLADVYTDLVFQPRLSRHTFMQEGHHFEFDDDGRLFVTGIVYNEMKGAFTSGERILYTTAMRNLLPDTPYRVDSGGIPDDIPSLTYEEFVAFHRRCYAPANARIFFYGSISTERHLDFLGRRLDELPTWEGGPTSIPSQPRWTEPRRAHGEYPATAVDAVDGRGFLHMSWLAGPSDDTEAVFALGMLMEAVLGNAGSPLRRALVTSPYGTDLSPMSGFTSHIRDSVLSVGLRGSNPEQVEPFEALVLDTWGAIRDTGIDAADIDAAIHQLSLERQEITRGSRPRGLGLMLSCLGDWQHGSDPLARLRAEPFGDVCNRALTNRTFLSDHIDRYVLSNPHRLTTIVAAVPGLSELNEAERRESAQALQRSMSDDETLRIRTDSEALRTSQRTPDSADALRTLPRLNLSDLPSTVQAEVSERDGDHFAHDTETNGLGYLDLLFDVGRVPVDALIDLPVLVSLMSGMGAGGENYAEFAGRKSRYTRGVSIGVDTRVHVDSITPQVLITLRTGALDRNIEPMMEVVDRILHAIDFTDTERAQTLIAARLNATRASVMPEGYAFVQRAAAAALGHSGAVREQLEGVSQLRHLARVSAELAENPEPVLARLDRLRRQIVCGDAVITNRTGSDDARRRIHAGLVPILDNLPRAGEVGPASPAVPLSTDRRVGIPYASSVTHTARLVPAPGYRDPDAPALTVAAATIRATMLYQRVRVEGGAYGAFALFDASQRSMGLLSYRDPHLMETFGVYDDVPSVAVGADDVEKAIFASVGAMDAPGDPRTRAYRVVTRALMGLTPEVRQAYREGILSVTEADVKRVVDRWLAVEAGQRSESAIAAPDRLLAATPAFSTKPLE